MLTTPGGVDDRGRTGILAAVTAPLCPCGLPEPYETCCGRYLDGEATPPTAEALMRSRYTAFARGDIEYLHDSWHPNSRPPAIDLDSSQRWTRLDILDRSRGGPFDSDGIVEFRAHYRHGSTIGELHERSRFVRESGRWLYLDGVVRSLPQRPPRT